MNRVSQSLFEMVTLKGHEMSFAVLDDKSCAILRDGEIVEAYASDDASVGRALKRYFKLVEQGGGARHPFEAMELSGHPHAG